MNLRLLELVNLRNKFPTVGIGKSPAEFPDFKQPVPYLLFKQTGEKMSKVHERLFRSL